MEYIFLLKYQHTVEYNFQLKFHELPSNYLGVKKLIFIDYNSMYHKLSRITSVQTDILKLCNTKESQGNINQIKTKQDKLKCRSHIYAY